MTPPRIDSQISDFIAAARHAPPPATWSEAACPFPRSSLPPLPSIRDKLIAERARTSKEYLVSSQGTVNCDAYDHEVASYRPLEWLGDGKLHQVYTEQLYSFFRGFSSGILSALREGLEANSTQAHIAWAYELDINLLEPPRPKRPHAAWAPLWESEKVMSDLFEAHMGGLVEEGRHQEVDVWVREFLNNLETDLRARAKTLETEARNRSKETRSEIKKRGRERNVFDGGWETDPITQIRRTSLLATCPADPPKTVGLPRCRWDDRKDADQKWHAHLVSGNATIACGRGSKQAQAHDAAVISLVESLGTNHSLCTYLMDQGDSSGGGRKRGPDN